jgi:hypothetical protein
VTIRRPDVALHNRAPNGMRPVPASYIRVVAEVVSAASDWADRAGKMGEYAAAGIPFYWLASLAGDNVASIDVRFLDHSIGGYRLLRTLTPEDEVSVLDVPIRIIVPWNQLPLPGPLRAITGPLPGRPPSRVFRPARKRRAARVNGGDHVGELGGAHGR